MVMPVYILHGDHCGPMLPNILMAFFVVVNAIAILSFSIEYMTRKNFINRFDLLDYSIFTSVALILAIGFDIIAVFFAMVAYVSTIL